MSSGHDRRGRGRARSARVLHERRGAAIANRFRVRLAMTLDGYRPTDHTPRLSLVLRARYASCAVGATADRPAWAMPFGDSFALSYRIHEGLFARHKRKISEASTRSGVWDNRGVRARPALRHQSARRNADLGGACGGTDGSGGLEPRPREIRQRQARVGAADSRRALRTTGECDDAGVPLSTGSSWPSPNARQPCRP